MKLKISKEQKPLDSWHLIYFPNTLLYATPHDETFGNVMVVHINYMMIQVLNDYSFKFSLKLFNPIIWF